MESVCPGGVSDGAEAAKERRCLFRLRLSPPAFQVDIIRIDIRSVDRISPSYSLPEPPPSSPANDDDNDDCVVVFNNYKGAVEEFTIEGLISSNNVRSFAKSSLIVDPKKAKWTSLHQFNECDLNLMRFVPTLLIWGDLDPYAPVRVQSKMFQRLADGRGGKNDRDGKFGAYCTWTVLLVYDHAVHLLDENGGGDRFVRAVKNFLSASD